MLNSVNFKFVMHQYVTVVSCVSVNKMFVLKERGDGKYFQRLNFFFSFRNETTTVVRKNSLKFKWNQYRLNVAS